MDVSVPVVEVVAIQVLDPLRRLLDSLEVEDVLLVGLVFRTVAREAMRGGVGAKSDSGEQAYESITLIGADVFHLTFIPW